MNRIRCVVERITFQSPDTGYSVLKVSPDYHERSQNQQGRISEPEKSAWGRLFLY